MKNGEKRVIIQTMKLSITSIAFLVAGTITQAATTIPQKGVTVEIWNHVKGDKVADMTPVIAQRPADDIYFVDKIDEIAVGADHYGARYTALLTAPESGEYTFYLSADDSAELLLSTDATAHNLRHVCGCAFYVGRYEYYEGWNTGKVRLQKGQQYYLVVHHKDSEYGEHVDVAWAGPGIERQIIPPHYYTPVIKDENMPIIEQTAAKNHHLRHLLHSLHNRQASIIDWLDKLPIEDKNQLNTHLGKILGLIEWQDSAKNAELLQPYAQAAQYITPSTDTPIDNPIAKKLLLLENAWLSNLSNDELLKLGAHRAAHTLGEIEANAQTVSATVNLSSAADKWRDELVSTGFYAPPGKMVTVKIPAHLTDKNLQLQVGHHFPQKDKPLTCMPNTTRYYKLQAEETQLITPHGGILLLQVPCGVELNNTPISISGALKAPKFVLRQDTNADWETLKQAPAPWGELVSEHVIILAPRQALQELTNPTELMTWWNINNRDLEDFYSYYPRVPFRMHAGHYAEEGISWWPLQWAPGSMPHLFNLAALQQENSALYLHEHGHHCDFDDMELSFWAESTPNWGGYYMKAREGKAFDWKDSHDRHLRNLFNPEHPGTQEIMQEKWYKIADRGTHHWSYPITSMMIGYAEEFGWDCVKETLKHLRNKQSELYREDISAHEDADQAKINRYLIGLSQAAGRDVRPYFAHFKLYVSENAAAYLDSLQLPAWDKTYLVQPTVLEIPENSVLSIPCGKAELLGYAAGPRIEWEPQTACGGTIMTYRDGHTLYAPKENFTGEDTLIYHLYNVHGKSVKKQLKIQVKPTSTP